ncbi:MAG: hypothetical protein A3J69_01545 [Candidatus Levybacteria bacterium RIFCSPHIGHO2_02_FULL_42_12]|nr:MAG: hypothetical protein A3J69_01545 [Candidatus Levybacteria bacterium RIFCSPHIGHO2_02_FULL_42_12]
MIVRYRKKFVWTFYVSLGLALLLTSYLFTFSWFLDHKKYNPVLFSILLPLGEFIIFLGLLALPLYFSSCYYLTKAKGYSGLLAVLGLIGLVGFIILFLLPDREKQTSTPEKQ